MDFQSVLRGGLPTLVSNISDNGRNSTNHTFAHGIMESLVPFFGSQYNPLIRSLMLLYNILGVKLGFDPTLVLTVFGFAWAANKVWRQSYSTAYGLVRTYLMASIQISSTDEMYSHMMKFLASQPAMVNSRSLTAESVSKSAWEEMLDEDMDADIPAIGPDGSGISLNFSNQEAKSPPRFVPALGTHGFWFQNCYYGLHRKQESLYDDDSMSGVPQFKDKEMLTISCFGRSPEPIKKLLQFAKEQYYEDHQAKTIVKRPSPPNTRRYGGRHSWMQVANRPVRPMATVVLDEQQKVNLLTDMNEYLHPSSPHWYSTRGIPLRRGYLFYGPPGTGKTSLSFALAGVFGLDIYVISLLEPSLTEEDLSSLFNTLPRRCVVLLEDIDTAGLARPVDVVKDDEDRENSEPKRGKRMGKDEWKVSDLARELRRQGDGNDKKGISLSGLLNAIDGVASQEGRVLIMTTNKPESLDEALIRPGRVDLQVGFANATQEQARELFERMMSLYSGPRNAVKKPETASLKTSSATIHNNGSVTNGSAHVNGHANGHAPLSSTQRQEKSELHDDERVGMSLEELKQIAKDFAAKIPSGQFSPAEIQGFLLKRKKYPRKALSEADAWVEGMLNQKVNKTKVLQVQ
ncbi:hypothetical protein GQ53DRAFT_229045 [Thozetella sp. PMI_491]|nr:hypothetical protein GQ53DRAFT_229045 [Thozetella sp. PMI_491]